VKNKIDPTAYATTSGSVLGAWILRLGDTHQVNSERLIGNKWMEECKQLQTM
jgi:hypothetical protein